MYRLISRRHGSAVLLATWLSACTGWQAESVAPERVLQDSHFVRRGVRVTTLDGRRLKIAHPALMADTPTGTSDTGAATLPLGQLRAMNGRRPRATHPAATDGARVRGAAE